MTEDTRRPNFFILGAPKCGTTSMATWLSEHSNAFMSPVKEPLFFSSDIIPSHPRNLVEYERLFANAKPCHSVLFEASTDYLFSKVAIGQILEYSGHPKFLVMVRNPVHMAQALHQEKLYQGDEHITDFPTAWRLQEERRHGRQVSALCRDPQLLLYGPICKLGVQLERLFGFVPPDSVKVINLEDLRRSPEEEFRSLLEFLNLPDHDRSAFPVHNEAKARRYPWLAHLLRPVANVRTRLGPTYRGLGLLSRLSDWNRISKPREPLDEDFEAALREYFREDVYLLSDLIDRDLSGWVDS